MPPRLGALPVLVVRQVPERAQDVMLGFAAGVMLAASFVSLIIPGLEAAGSQGATAVDAVTVISVGILSGAACLWSVNRFAPHQHFITGREGLDTQKAGAMIFVISDEVIPETHRRGFQTHGTAASWKGRSNPCP